MHYSIAVVLAGGDMLDTHAVKVTLTKRSRRSDINAYSTDI
jgi:hypothetical protein